MNKAPATSREHGNNQKMAKRSRADGQSSGRGRDDEEEEQPGDEDTSSSEVDAQDSSSDDGEDAADDEAQQFPLEERIKRQEERGVNLNDRRLRKLKAIKVASERLCKIKKEKATSENPPPTKKKSKHAPTEASSKRADFYKRKLDLNENGIGVDIGAHRYKPRDPRVNNLNGHLDMERFETNFAFLQEMRQQEIVALKKRLSARKKTGPSGQERRRRLGITNDGGSLEEDKSALKQLLHEKAEFERRQVDRAVQRAVKQKLGGSNAKYTPKRKELKRMHLEAKYEELQKRGGDKAVDRVVAKRRKKNKSKDAGMLGGRGQNA